MLETLVGYTELELSWSGSRATAQPDRVSCPTYLMSCPAFRVELYHHNCGHHEAERCL